jgi:hypothetical protein
MNPTTRVRSQALSLLVLAASSAASVAQSPLSEGAVTRVDMQVFDPDVNAWTTMCSAAPGSRVEWRVVVSYTGTNTNVYALGSMAYQPTFSNIDNTGPDVDQLAPWRNGGSQGSAITNSMLSESEGASGHALATYGRVRFGGTAMNTASLNVVTTHRHGGDFAANAAPAGSWLRVAGSSVVLWPQEILNSEVIATPTALNAINRGLLANQPSLLNPVTQGPPYPFHVQGTQGLVVFRGALLLSPDARTDNITLGIAPGTQQRVGGINTKDDTRYIAWQTGIIDGGSWRTGFTINSATIVIPTPGGAGLVGVACVLGLRRRR